MKKLSRGVRYGARDAVLSDLSGTVARSSGDAKGGEGRGKQESTGTRRRRSRDVGSQRAKAKSTRKKAKM